MKTIKSFFTLIAIISFMQVNLANTVTRNATTNVAMLVQTVSNSENSVALRMIRNNSDKLIIHLKDASGTVHYFEKVNNQEDYYRNFLLQNLPNGNYHFSIKKSDATVIVKGFSLENGIVTLVNPNEILTSTKENEAYVMQLNSTDNQSVMLNYQNNSRETITLRLKDLAGKTWHFVKIKSNTSYTKRLILTEIPDGSYNLSIEGEEAIQTFFIKDGKVKLERDIPKA